MNNIVLVGRLTKDPEVTESENGVKRSQVNLAVTRNYKNSDGVYETDFINCVLWNNIAQSTAEYCKKGDIVGVKGRLETSTYTNDKDEKLNNTEVIVEKITFLSSNNEKSKDDSKMM